MNNCLKKLIVFVLLCVISNQLSCAIQDIDIDDPLQTLEVLVATQKQIKLIRIGGSRGLNDQDVHYLRCLAIFGLTAANKKILKTVGDATKAVRISCRDKIEESGIENPYKQIRDFTQTVKETIEAYINRRLEPATYPQPRVHRVSLEPLITAVVELIERSAPSETVWSGGDEDSELSECDCDTLCDLSEEDEDDSFSFDDSYYSAILLATPKILGTWRDDYSVTSSAAEEAARQAKRDSKRFGGYRPSTPPRPRDRPKTSSKPPMAASVARPCYKPLTRTEITKAREARAAAYRAEAHRARELAGK